MTAVKSLASRLVLTTVVLVLGVSLLIGVATTLAMRGYLRDQLDDQVRRSLMVRPGGGPGSEVGMLRAVIPPDGTPRAELVEPPPDGGPIREVVVTGDAVDQLAELPADGEIRSVRLEGVGDYRVLSLDSRGATVVVGLPEDEVTAAVARLVRVEVLLALLATGVAAGAALVVVRRQLRPLTEVAATARTVAALPLASGDAEIPERVPAHLTDEDTEVGRVGAALNTLLEHVETSLAARERSEQQVRQFVADASHELRSPLATIAGYTELARRRPDDPEALAAALDKAEEETQRMTSLVEDLLLLARLDAGRPLAQESVDLTRLLVEAVADAQVVAPDHAWRVEVPDDAVDAPYEVLGDELRLHQVVTNLLTNARKHTPAGTTVTVAVRRDGFSVHDDGPGFPPELVDHAFERFVRGDTARTRGREVGVGLGLALVEAIVAAHGGTVRLTSAPGDTTIDVVLPPSARGDLDDRGQRGGHHREQLLAGDAGRVGDPGEHHLLDHRRPPAHHQAGRGGVLDDLALRVLPEDPAVERGPGLLVDLAQRLVAALGGLDQREVALVVGHDVVEVRRQRGQHPLHRLAVGRRRGLRDQVVGGPTDHRLVEGVLVAEVVVEQAPRDAGLLGQQVDRELVEGAVGEQPDPEVEQLLAALLRGQAGARRRTLAHAPTLLTLFQ